MPSEKLRCNPIFKEKTFTTKIHFNDCSRLYQEDVNTKSRLLSAKYLINTMNPQQEEDKGIIDKVISK